jgi:hypothetical protein
MSEQRIDQAADAATTTDADPGDGTGLAAPGAHLGGGTGGTDDMTVPDDERLPVDENPQGDTEGEQTLKAGAANRPDGPDAAP